MSNQGNRDLRERTKAFALQIIALYSNLPKSPEAQVLGRQLLKSGTSVGAQYREAWRARSRAEFASKIQGALQELEETSYWFELLGEGRIVDDASLKELRQEADELMAIFVASVKTARKRA